MLHASKVVRSDPKLIHYNQGKKLKSSLSYTTAFKVMQNLRFDFPNRLTISFLVETYEI